MKHKALFPYKAYEYYKNLNINPRAVIVHEPVSSYFMNKSIPSFIESHGVERRGWEIELNGNGYHEKKNQISLKTRLLFPLWRLNGCDKGLKSADKLLLINKEDQQYVINKYERKASDILLFSNGVNFNGVQDHNGADNQYTVLFNGSWIARKGIHVLIDAAKILYHAGLKLNYLLIGTGHDSNLVYSYWPEYLIPFVTVIANFSPEDESKYIRTSSLFVLPSFFEGQPLSLLQAMAEGRCCITSNCCGQKDIIENGKTGFLFEKGDAKELASLMSMCYHNKELSITIGQSAQNHVKKLSWDSVSDKVVNFVLENSVHSESA